MNDYNNYILEIRGDKVFIDEIESLGVILPGCSSEDKKIAMTVFGTNARYKCDKPSYITIDYHYSNSFITNSWIYGYLHKVLEVYPTCWIKNSFETEMGVCGFWIGRIKNGLTEIQQHDWTELTNDEECGFDQGEEVFVPKTDPPVTLQDYYTYTISRDAIMMYINDTKKKWIEHLKTCKVQDETSTGMAECCQLSFTAYMNATSNLDENM